MTASATRLRIQQGQIETPPTREWQKQNWAVARRVGEIRYTMAFLRYAITKARFGVALRARSGDEPEMLDDGPAVELLDRIDSRSIGLPYLFGSWGIHWQTVGETHLLCQHPDSEDEVWSLRSTEEVRRLNAQQQVWNGDAFESLGEDDLIWRSWRPDEERADLPDAPLTSVREEAEDLLLLTSQIRAANQSRLSAGMLLVPQELTILPLRTDDDDQDPELFDKWDEDAFSKNLATAMTTPIKDAKSALRVVPIVIRGPGDRLDQLRWITFDRPIDAQAAGERSELISRIASGLDMPQSIIEGRGDMNHWTAWLEDESTYKQHIDPVLLEMMNSFTRGVFQPLLREMGEARWRDLIVWRDLSSLVHHPDRLQDAILLYDRKELSGEALRRIGGFNDTDVPTEEEIAKRREAQPESPDDGGAEDGAEVDEGTPDSPNPAQAAATILGRRRRLTTARVASAGETIRRRQTIGRRLATIDLSTVTRLTQLWDDAVDRALERAGARVRTKSRKFTTMQSLIDGVPNQMVVRTLGDQFSRLGLEEGDLIDEDSFSETVAATVVMLTAARRAAAEEVLELEDVDDLDDWDAWNEQEGQREAEAGSALLETAIIAYALSRLFGRDGGRENVLRGEGSRRKFPTSAVWAAMTRAGGGTVSTPDVDHVRGIGNGPWVQERLREAGFVTARNRWIYGDPGLRETNFDPHRRIDGVLFQGWDDPSLATPSAGSWIGESFMYPGDHAGCLCTWERELIAE